MYLFLLRDIPLTCALPRSDTMVCSLCYTWDASAPGGCIRIKGSLNRGLCGHRAIFFFN